MWTTVGEPLLCFFSPVELHGQRRQQQLRDPLAEECYSHAACAAACAQLPWARGLEVRCPHLQPWYVSFAQELITVTCTEKMMGAVHL